MNQGIVTKGDTVYLSATCSECGSALCNWEAFCGKIDKMAGNLLKEVRRKDKIVYIDKDGKEVSNYFIRRCLCTSYTYFKLGTFGDDGVHEVPMCVASKIRKMYPSPDMKYPDIPIDKIFKYGKK